MRVVAAMFMAGALACAPAYAAEITVGLAAAPSSADPHFHAVGPNNSLARHIFGALVRTDAELTPVPDLAESWTLVDSQTWKIALRQGVTFHDGTPFTANDVVFSLCRARGGVGPTQSFTNLPKALDQVDVVDPHTIVLHTKRPEPSLLDLMGGFAIISANSAGAGQVTFSAAENCGLAALPPSNAFDGGKMANGTGPYRLAKYTSGDVIVLEANTAYYRGAPRWSRVTLKPVPRTGSRVAGLLAGDFDLIENPSSQDLPAIKAKGGFAWTVTPSDRVIFLQPDIGRAKSPNVTAPDGRNPLQDARVREAISLAIDRGAIAARLMDGLAVPANQYVTPGMFGDMKSLPPRAYDPARARALLAEAGYPDGFTLTLSSPNDRYINDAQVAQAIGQYFTRVGIRTTVDAMTQTVFFPRRAKRELSLSLGGWGNSTGESSMMRYFIVSTNMERGIGTSNYGAYHSEDFDAAFLPTLQDMNEDTRRANTEKATAIALKDNAQIPLYWETTVWAYKDRYRFTGRTDQVTDVDGLVLK